MAYKYDKTARYAKTHDWARVEGDLVVCGISDYAQHALSDVGGAAAALDGRTGGWMDFAEQIDDRLVIGETMMLGLRLVREGVAYDRFLQRHRASLLDMFGADIHELVALGLLEVLPDRVRLTHQARLVGNQVFARFLP